MFIYPIIKSLNDKSFFVVNNHRVIIFKLIIILLLNFNLIFIQFFL